MIEPLDGEPDGAGTQPSTPGESPPAARRRIRRDVVIGAAAIAAVALIGKGLSNGSDPPSPPSTGPSPTAGRTAVDPQGLPAPRAGDVAACPPQARCLTQEAGNGLALAPVRSRLPKAEVVRFHSVLLETPPWEGRLWYRELGFRLPDGSAVEVRISVRVQPVEEQAGRIGTQSFAVASIGRYLVRVTTAQAAGLAPVELRRIAGDERLLTT